MSSAYGTTIFCDDIRDEVSGKKTLVGVYAERMIVDTDFPVIVPTMGFYIHLLEPLADPSHPVQIKVFIPGDTDDEVVIDVNLPENRSDLIDSDSVRDHDAKFLSNILAFRVSPLLLRKEGRIKVRAYKSDTEVKLGTLLVTKAERGQALPESDNAEQQG